MRIGIDARELVGRPTGVGRYLRGLLEVWSTSEGGRGHEFVLYAHGPLEASLGSGRFATRVVPGKGGALWEQWALPAAMPRDQLDAFFAPGYTAPLLTTVPVVVAIHDVSFAAHPEWFTAREGLRRRLLTRRAAAAARAVVTISEFSKRELVDLLRVPAEKVHVVPPGLPQISGPSSAGANAVRPCTVLYVGSIFNRRHLPDLIQAVGQMVRAGADIGLDLVGDNRSHPHQDIEALIERQGANGRLRWHRYLADDDVHVLYRSARAFAFLSEYEGLGLTPLEALAAGTPVVLLDTAVARESCGEAALYVPQDDATALVDALTRLLFDGPTRDTLLARAPGALARFDPARAGDKTLGVIESAR